MDVKYRASGFDGNGDCVTRPCFWQNPRSIHRGRWKSPTFGNGIVKKTHAMFAELKIHICHRYRELEQTSKMLCTMG